MASALFLWLFMAWIFDSSMGFPDRFSATGFLFWRICPALIAFSNMLAFHCRNDCGLTSNMLAFHCCNYFQVLDLYPLVGPLLSIICSSSDQIWASMSRGNSFSLFLGMNARQKHHELPLFRFFFLWCLAALVSPFLLRMAVITWKRRLAIHSFWQWGGFVMIPHVCHPR